MKIWKFVFMKFDCTDSQWARVFSRDNTVLFVSKIWEIFVYHRYSNKFLICSEINGTHRIKFCRGLAYFKDLYFPALARTVGRTRSNVFTFDLKRMRCVDPGYTFFLLTLHRAKTRWWEGRAVSEIWDWGPENVWWD